MKTSSLVINSLLGIAIIVLYVLHFTHQESSPSQEKKTEKTKQKSPKTNPEKAANTQALKIAYVNVDSLDAKYEFSINARKQMETKERLLQGDLENRARNLQNEAINFEKTAAGLSREQIQAKQQELMQKQQSLEQYRQSAGQGFVQEEQELQKKLLNNIGTFMKRYAEENGYDYILTYSGLGSGTLYGNPTLEITQEVIEGLNAEYREESPK